MVGTTNVMSIIIGIMFFGLIFGAFQIMRLFRIGKDFKKASRKLRKEGGSIALKAYLSEKNAENANPFARKQLRNTFEEYRNSLFNTNQISSYTDITEYYHSEYINSISHGTICEWIPSTMTGLGLLGTFIGLTMGIGGLDVKSTEGLLNGINILLEGMYTAFYTSIAGVIASLIFSLFYKIAYGSAIAKMEDFLDLFQENKLDCAEKSPENMLLAYQQQQTESLQKFTDEFAVNISNSMAEILLPVTAKMESTIEEFAKVASTQQKEGLEQIVKEFISSMNDALGGQFEALGATIENMCEWQKNSAEQMQKIINEMCETATEIESIHELTQKSVAEMNEFMGKVNEMQTAISQQAELARKQIEIANTINEKNAEYIEKITGCEESVAKLAESVNKEAENARNAIMLLQERCDEQVKALSEAAQKEMTILSESTKILAESSHQQIQALSLTAQDEMQMLSEQAARLAEDNKAQLETLTKASSEQLDLLSGACTNIVETSRLQIASTVAVAEAQTESLIQTTNDFVEFVQQQNQTFTDAVKQEISGITSHAVQATSGLDKAAASMEASAKLLDKNLDTVLTRTFNEFDRGLAEITQHLSGTIADVRDTTESVPYLIAKAQTQCEDTLKVLSDQTQKYTDAMTKLIEEVNKTVMPVEGGSQ